VTYPLGGGAVTAGLLGFRPSRRLGIRRDQTLCGRRGMSQRLVKLPTWARSARTGCGCGLAVGLLVLGGAAQLPAAPAGPPGRLVQLAGELGCIHKTGVGSCARGRAVASPGDVTLSPDGRHAYVAAFDSQSVAVFARDRRSGALRQLPGKRGCLGHRGAGPCAFGRALGSPIALEVSPDGRNLYVAATGSDALAVFRRNQRSGALRHYGEPAAASATSGVAAASTAAR
jgi:Lactonase, 7-bladed beta-propeller